MTYEERSPISNGRAIALALGVSPGRISQCKSEGGFSYQHQCVLEKASAGVLQAREEDEPHKAAS